VRHICLFNQCRDSNTSSSLSMVLIHCLIVGAANRPEREKEALDISGNYKLTRSSSRLPKRT
jgi:hypothetical protein